MLSPVHAYRGGRRFAALCLLGMFLAPGARLRGADAILHVFAGNGGSPLGDVTVVGSLLYGLTSLGGANNSGTIFRMGFDGSGFATPQSLALDSKPPGSLALDGAFLYGMTNDGSGNDGVVFKYQYDPTGAGVLTPIHAFTGTESDGSGPLGSLVVSGGKLYGMTPFGGTEGTGTIFRLDSDGSNFELLHSFTGAGNDGSQPFGSLTLSGSFLYGTTANGGGGLNGGTVFRYNLADDTFSVLQSFAANSLPSGSLVLADGMLYGTTAGGGSESGTIFRLDANGGGYQELHSFGSLAGDGSVPLGALTVVGSRLYGTTSSGGLGFGTVFSLDFDGGNYEVVHAFAGGTADGATPTGSLTWVGDKLVGTTSSGGLNGLGTVFAVDAVPEPGAIALVLLAGALAAARRRHG